MFTWTVISVMVGLAWLVFYYWDQLFPDSRHDRIPAGFLIWTGKGLVLPILFWILANADLIPGLSPFLPNVAVAKSSGGKWLEILCASIAPGLIAISIFWASVTFAWMSAVIAMRATERNEVAILAAIWSVLLSPFIWLSLHRFGIGGVPLALLIGAVPLVHCTMSLALKPKVAPTYSRAIAKMKRGQYTEAEKQVVQELEKRHDDFDGWMMLADLYANHFHELGEADATIRALCNEPNINSVQISTALNRLADWHLKLADNPVAARLALDEICLRLPGTHIAKMAQIRIDQLPTTREELREQKKAKTIRMPALNDQLGESSVPEPPRMDWTREQSLDLVHQHSRKLSQNPNDIQAREKMAIALAERLGKIDLAIDQLELLIGMPDPAPRKIAEWLGLIASWHVKYRNDTQAARKVMERLIHEYPESPQAFAAQRRLNLWDVENQIRKARSLTAT